MKKALIIFFVMLILVLSSCNSNETPGVITLESVKPVETTATEAFVETETTQSQQIITTTMEQKTEETTADPGALANTEELYTFQKSILIFCDVYDETIKEKDGIKAFQIPVVMYAYDDVKNAIKKTEGIGKLIQDGELKYLFGGEGSVYNGSEYATQISAKERLYFKIDSNTILGTIRVYDSERNVIYQEDIDGISCELGSIPEGEYIVTIETMHKAFEVVFPDGTKIIPEMDMSYLVLKLTR